MEKQDEDQNRETIVESENKEVDEDVEAGVSGEKVEDADHEVKADVVEWEAMDVDEKVNEKTAWAGKPLKGSEASEMRELKQQRWQRQRKRHLKINISEMVTILLSLLLTCIPYFWQSLRQIDW